MYKCRVYRGLQPDQAQPGPNSSDPNPGGGLAWGSGWQLHDSAGRQDPTHTVCLVGNHGSDLLCQLAQAGQHKEKGASRPLARCLAAGRPKRARRGQCVPPAIGPLPCGCKGPRGPGAGEASRQPSARHAAARDREGQAREMRPASHRPTAISAERNREGQAREMRPASHRPTAIWPRGTERARRGRGLAPNESGPKRTSHAKASYVPQALLQVGSSRWRLVELK